MTTIETIPDIETCRVILSAFEEEDAIDLLGRAPIGCDDAMDNEAMHDIGVESTRFIMQLANSISFRAHALHLIWAIRERRGREVVGSVSFSQWSEHEGQVDYEIVDLAGNIELAADAVETVIHWAFASIPGLRLIRGECSSDDRLTAIVNASCNMRLARCSIELTPTAWRVPRRISEWMIMRGSAHGNATRALTPEEMSLPRTTREQKRTNRQKK